MNLKSRPLCQPESYFGMLVSGIVIDDEMDRKISGHDLIDAFEEGKKLLMAMAWFAFGEYRPGGDVEGGKEGGRAMANIVMSDPFHVAQADRQHRLGTVQSLNLGLLIDRQDDSVIGRVQIKTHHISDLFHEEGITGQLEIPGPVRLDGERPEDSMHGGFRQAIGIGCLPDAPVTSGRWLVLQRAPEQECDLLIRDRPGTARPEFIIKTTQAAFHKALAPL